MNCPTCGAVVNIVGNDGSSSRYIHVQPAPLDLGAVKLRAIEDFNRIVESRLRARPQLGALRVMREELHALRRVLLDGEEVPIIARRV